MDTNRMDPDALVLLAARIFFFFARFFEHIKTQQGVLGCGYAAMGVCVVECLRTLWCRRRSLWYAGFMPVV